MENFEDKFYQMIERKNELLKQPKERCDGLVREEFILSSKNEYRSTTEIVFQDKLGHKIEFNCLLPEDWTFMSYELQHVSELKTQDKASPKINSFFCDCREKKITYGDLTRNGSLLGLLHEIGHASLNKADHNEVFYSYVDNFDNRDITTEIIQQRGENPENYLSILVYDAFGKNTGGIDNDEVWFNMLVPKELIQQYGKEWATTERGAWAFALKKLKQLRNQGFIIEPALNNLEDLLNEIYNCLETYDKSFQKRFGEAVNPFTRNKKFTKFDNIL